MDRDSYPCWRNQLLNLLTLYKLTAHVDIAIQRPPASFPDGSVNPAYEKWEQEDCLVKSWFLSSISTTLHKYVVKCSTACEIWLTLETLLADVSKFYHRNIRDQIRNLRKTPTTTMTEYLFKAKRLNDLLRPDGAPYSETKLIDLILDGLTKTDYSSFLSLLYLQLPKSFDDLLGVLVQEEQLRLRIHNITGGDDVALATYSSPRPPFRGRGRSTSRFNPHVRPQWRPPNTTSWRPPWQPRQFSYSNYWKSPNSSTWRPSIPGTSTSSTPPVVHTPLVCHLCLKEGHCARTCSDRTNSAYKSAVVQTPVVSDSWCVDTGATQHMTASPHLLSSLQPHSGQEAVVVGNGQHLPITHSGNSSLEGHQGTLLLLRHILLVPNLSTNLLSVHRFSMDNNCYFIFYPSFVVKDNITHHTILHGSNVGGLYVLPLSTKALAAHTTVSSSCWHRRLGHPSSSVLQTIFKQLSITPGKHVACDVLSTW